MSERPTAAELGRRLRSKEISVAEAHSLFADKTDTLNAFLRRTADQEQIDRAQAMIDAGDGGPLTGVPVAVKDNFVTKGVETTCASKLLEGWIPPYDGHVIQRLNESGLPSLGKTNLDEFAMGTSGETSTYGPSLNPHDPERVPGGSSSGSAAAVGGGLAPLALGSDTGGSIRLPAALSGVVGFKPTYGRISRYGLVAFASSLDQIGPFAANVEDAALLAQAISGHDSRDSTSLKDEPISTTRLKDRSLKGIKLGVPKQLTGDAIQPAVREAFDSACDALRREGVEIAEVDLPMIEVGVTTYYIIAPSEASSNLARFDGIRYGQRIEEGDHNQSTAATRGRLFGEEVKLRIMLGTYALSAGYYDAFYVKAQKVRRRMADEFNAAFQEFDAIISPTSPALPFQLGELTDDPMALKVLDLCTIPANLGGFPSISIPGPWAQGLPTGICLTSPVRTDEDLLALAWSSERALGVTTP